MTANLDFSHRSTETERLDRGEYSVDEYEHWHREMWYIHRLFGESRALRKTLGIELRSLREVDVSVLDVGCGSGDLLTQVLRLVRESKAIGIGADENPQALSAARAVNIPVVQCNARELPFADKSIDFVMSSLTLHHFKDDDAVDFLREARRVARRKVFIVDLERSRAAYAAYRMLGRVLLQKFTFEDGSLSIRRGFRPAELLELARAAGYDNPVVTSSAAYRLVLTG